ncbi:hypothetical protein [Arabiibacter massiliensis]|uniref:hypothetical protein n=1 Tax=Arabiibacter massiliensis TaxID=1870985 RepID=UPI0009BB41BC|nr:hypothetical protein [Arabiibacter massiliensis]
MNEAEFKRAYAQIEADVTASDELKARTKALLRAEELPAKSASPRVGDPRGSKAAAWRWRPAIAACLAVVVGVGLLAAAGSFERVAMLLSGNSFSLAAYAEEAPDGAADLGFDRFHPTRTSAGYLYDAASDAVDFSVVTVSRYYAFDMSVAGKNVESVAYSIDGEGVSYGSWKSSQGSEGEVAEETSNSFTVPFDDGRQVVREIGLNYVLDEEERVEFDRCYQSGDADAMEALLAKCDAKRLANVTIGATATFADGSSAAKAYGLVPAEGFETMYRAYLTQLPSASDAEAWASLAGEPALFALVEKGR